MPVSAAKILFLQAPTNRSGPFRSLIFSLLLFRSLKQNRIHFARFLISFKIFAYIASFRIKIFFMLPSDIILHKRKFSFRIVPKVFTKFYFSFTEIASENLRNHENFSDNFCKNNIGSSNNLDSTLIFRSIGRYFCLN